MIKYAQKDIEACKDVLELQGSNGLLKAVDFVLATIQQQFHTVPNALEEWEELGVLAPSMWGMKMDGWVYIRNNKDRLYALTQNAVANNDEVDFIDTLLEVPGLGVIKAAFVAQLYGLNVGCLDTHNETLYCADAMTFYVPARLSARLRLERISSYVDFTQRIGGSSDWWGNWCLFMAEKYPQHYADAEAVSEQHIQCLL